MLVGEGGYLFLIENLREWILNPWQNWSSQISLYIVARLNLSRTTDNKLAKV